MTYGLIVKCIFILFSVFHLYRTSGADSSAESTAVYYSRILARNLDDPEAKIISYKVFDGFKKEDITDEVKAAKNEKMPDNDNYDKYSDPQYIRTRFNVPEGSSRDENFNVEVAGVYLRRMDSCSKIKKLEGFSSN